MNIFLHFSLKFFSFFLLVKDINSDSVVMLCTNDKNLLIKAFANEFIAGTESVSFWTFLGSKIILDLLVFDCSSSKFYCPISPPIRINIYQCRR